MRTIRGMSPVVIAGVVGALWAARAHADDPAVAESLFESGVAAMKAGKYDKACPDIAESFRLEDRPGTLFTLAECWRKAGKLATALARYDEYLRRFERMSAGEKEQQRGRDKFAREHSAQLKKDVPRLTIDLSLSAPAGTVVERDGEALGKPALGKPLPIDPGEHKIVARAGDRIWDEATITLAPREQKIVRLDADDAATGAVTVDDPGTGETSNPRPPPEHDRPSSGSTQRTLGYVLGGVGIAGVVVGAVTGLMVLGKKSTIEDNCGIGGEETACNPDGKKAADDAKSLATVSTIAFGVGIVGLGAGTVLVLTAPSPSAGAQGLGVRFHGTF